MCPYLEKLLDVREDCNTIDRLSIWYNNSLRCIDEIVGEVIPKRGGKGTILGTIDDDDAVESQIDVWVVNNDSEALWSLVDEIAADIDEAAQKTLTQSLEVEEMD